MNFHLKDLNIVIKNDGNKWLKTFILNINFFCPSEEGMVTNMKSWNLVDFVMNGTRHIKLIFVKLKLSKLVYLMCLIFFYLFYTI